jgi:hypothetical protein
MTCRLVSFAKRVCRIDIEEGVEAPRFTAHMTLVDEERGTQPVTFANGQIAEIHATSEELAMSSAVHYLEHVFGARAQN